MVSIKQSERYNKTSELFIFTQQGEQVYYTKYLERHQSWLRVIKIKVDSRIIDNILN